MIEDDQKEEDAGYCLQCNGSGEGLHDGSTCWRCKGSGREKKQVEDGDFIQHWERYYEDFNKPGI